MIAGGIFKEIISSSSSAEESDPNEDEEHTFNPTAENQIQTETHSHSNSEHQNTSTTTDRTRENEVLWKIAENTFSRSHVIKFHSIAIADCIETIHRTTRSNAAN